MQQSKTFISQGFYVFVIYQIKVIQSVTIIQDSKSLEPAGFAMINYVLKPELLPITKTANVHHFYQFQAKQIKQKEQEEIQKVDDLLRKIQEQETHQNHTKTHSQKINYSLDERSQPQISKTFFIESKSNMKGKPMSSNSHEEFYIKNKKWKQNVEAEILKRKNQKIQQQQKQFKQSRKPLSQKQSSSHHNVTNSFHKQNTSELHAFQSKGPITGWTQRFHDYIKKRLPQGPSQQSFRPTINKNSQIIASRMVGKVEDRLIKFGQVMKIRKHETLIQQIEKIGKLPSTQHHLASTQSNQSQFFYRLYKQAENTNRKHRELLQKSSYSFKPEITKISQDMQKKVQEKRDKNPLYAHKKMSKTQTQRLLQLYKQTGRPYNQVEFQNFIRRNELLMEKRAKTMQRKGIQDLQKQQKDMKQCTFIPLLNPKSLRMLQKMQQDKILKEELQYGYSDEQISLEQSPSQLFNNIQSTPNGHNNSQNTTKLKQKQKYQYSHSYGQKSEFDYEMRTPQADKQHNESQNNNFFYRDTTKSKQKDLSQMDSLQFSADKYNKTHIGNSIFHTKSDRTVSNSFIAGEDQIINYELTFSNKKLSSHLSQANRDEGTDSRQVKQIEQNQRRRHLVQQSILIVREQQQEEMHIQNEVIDAHSRDNKISDEVENSWEDELDQVKNRLQRLMESNSKKPKHN